ncbi:MAG: glycosyltransferase 87 family protein, partial [Verrucomicrobiae bacterium]|nr:glycosyltransferase 87 family protein [Verrucomicrobiae bacterium]
ACLFYVWHRVTKVFGLGEAERWLWLALFGSWACVRVTLGSGQLGLMCLAAVLWAFPFERGGDGVRLAVSAIKHTLAYPVWLWLLWRRPRQLLGTALVGLVPFVCVLLFNPVPVTRFMQSTLDATEKMVVKWDGGTSLLSALRLTWPLGKWWYLIVGALWVTLFLWLVWRCRQQRALVSALLLMSLWPFYHRPYDFVVAGPFLGMLLAQQQRGWAVGLTVAALGWYERLESLRFWEMGWLRVVASWYYPAIIFACLGLVAWRLRTDLSSQANFEAERARTE